MPLRQFRLIRKLGCGSTSTVYLAERKYGDQPELVCIKRVPLPDQMTSADRARKLQEVDILSETSACPRIIRLHECFRNQGALFLVLELAVAGNMAEAIEARRGRYFDEQCILRWVAQLAMALDYLHTHAILHRDIKTKNILLDSNREIKLADFGIAHRLVQHGTDVLAKTLIGTPNNMAPEILAGRPYGRPADIWAAGCVLFELMCLKHPFESVSINELVPKIMSRTVPPVSGCFSRRCVKLVDRLLSLDEQTRPTANALAMFATCQSNANRRHSQDGRTTAPHKPCYKYDQIESERWALERLLGETAFSALYRKCTTHTSFLESARACGTGTACKRVAQLGKIDASEIDRCGTCRASFICI